MIWRKYGALLEYVGLFFLLFIKKCSTVLHVSRRDSGQLEIASDLPNGRPERELIHFENFILGLTVALRLVFS